MKRIILVLGLVAVVALAAGIAVAQSDHKRDDGKASHRMMNGQGGPGMRGWGGGRGMRGGMGMGGGMFLGPERVLLTDRGGRLAEKLDLTGTQKDKLRDIGGDLERKEIQLRANLETAGLDLRDLMRSDSPSASAVDAKIENLSQLRGDLMKANARAVLDARKVLTSDQRKKLADLRHGRPGGGAGRDGQGRDGKGHSEHRNSR
ncbi:MAG TPA: Spy/CpxP family protein refolding chaperone [Candidatus Eisenbacteria bacterium]|nr:Spy/CpxP family protein refolding chaperone [Candidatus Eisenbacteria bacterium]